MHKLKSANPEAISQLGIDIYNRLYKDIFEQEHDGKFLAVNVNDESVTLGDTPSQALLKAKAEKPNGLFHLIRIGYPAAFGMSLANRNVPSNRLHRQ